MTQTQVGINIWSDPRLQISCWSNKDGFEYFKWSKTPNILSMMKPRWGSDLDNLMPSFTPRWSDCRSFFHHKIVWIFTILCTCACLARFFHRNFRTFSTVFVGWKLDSEQRNPLLDVLTSLMHFLLHFRVGTRIKFHPTLRERSAYELPYVLYITL